jgi:lipopolysaccharide export system permease protein
MKLGGTLQHYFAMRFLSATMAVFLGVFLLVAMVDYVEMVRRTSEVTNVSGWVIPLASLSRVPQITEKILPFCVLLGAISCFLTLSRRLELVVARSAGVSAWQFVAPPLIVALVLGIVATTIYNPVSAWLQEHSNRLQTEMHGESQSGPQGNSATGFWVRQRSEDGQSIINAAASREQGVRLAGIVAFTFDTTGQFKERIEAKTAVLEQGYWRLEEARIYASGLPMTRAPTYLLSTNLTPEQVRESFATPETVPFWKLPLYIEIADNAGLSAAAYRVQYQKLLALPFLFVSMVLLAAAVSLHFFRFGGVQKMVLSGVIAGFLLYIVSKVLQDFAKAELLSPLAAAWVPVLLGGLTGILALLYQEDG